MDASMYAVTLRGPRLQQRRLSNYPTGKVIWKFTPVSSHLSLLAELPVDSCASSAPLIRRPGRASAESTPRKSHGIEVMLSCNCQIINYWGIKLFLFVT